MERNQIIKSLIAEGFKIETLANMSDKQLQLLGSRILSEASTVTMTKLDMSKPQDKGILQGMLKDPTKNAESLKRVTFEGDVNEEECDECNQEMSEEPSVRDLRHPKIQKLVDEVNNLILQSVDKYGDPISVVDSSSTWESPMIFKPILYNKKGQLKIENSYPLESRKNDIDIINSRNMKEDGIPSLLFIRKLYRKALKQHASETGRFKPERDEDLQESKKPSEGLTKKQKSDVVKKAKVGEDIGKKGKGFEDVAKKASKQYGSEEKGKKVAAAAMWKNIQREDTKKTLEEKDSQGFVLLKWKDNGKFEVVKHFKYNLSKNTDYKGTTLLGMYDTAKEANNEANKLEKGKKEKLNEWVEGLVNENYHPITTKGEITSLIKQKLNESSVYEKMSLPEDTNECVFADGTSLEQSLAQKVANDNAMNKFNARFPNKPYIKHVETAHRTEDGNFRYIVGIKLKPEMSDESEESLEETKK